MPRSTWLLVLTFTVPVILSGQSDLFEWSLYTSLNAGQRVEKIAFSPDGSRGAVATLNGAVQVFDLNTRSESLRRMAQQGSRVLSLQFSSDSSSLMTAAEDGNILISSLIGGADHAVRAKGRLLSATLSKDGALVASAADDKSVIVWDVQSGRQLNQLQHKSKKPFFALGFMEKDTSLIGVSQSGTICEWDVKTRSLLRQLQDSDQVVQSASVGDSGTLFSLGTEFADFQKGGFGQLSSARAGMPSLGASGPGAGSPDQRSGSGGPLSGAARPTDVYRENRIKIYDLSRGSLAKTLDGINGAVTSLSLSSDGHFVAFIRNVIKESFLEVYDTRRGVEVASTRLPGAGTAVSFSHQGQWVGTTTDRGDVMVWAVKGLSIPVTPSELRGGKFTITSTSREPLVAPARPALLAVMDFDLNGAEPGDGRAVSDMVRTRLGEGQNVRIVERAHMEQVIREQNFHYSDKVDASTAVSLGRLLGAGKMVFGSVSKLTEKFVINVREVDVESGVIDGEREVTCAAPCSSSDLQEAVIVLKPVLVK